MLHVVLYFNLRVWSGDSMDPNLDYLANMCIWCLFRMKLLSLIDFGVRDTKEIAGNRQWTGFYMITASVMKGLMEMSIGGAKCIRLLFYFCYSGDNLCSSSPDNYVAVDFDGNQRTPVTDVRIVLFRFCLCSFFFLKEMFNVFVWGMLEGLMCMTDLLMVSLKRSFRN